MKEPNTGSWYVTIYFKLTCKGSSTFKTLLELRNMHASKNFAIELTRVDYSPNCLNLLERLLDSISHITFDLITLYNILIQRNCKKDIIFVAVKEKFMEIISGLRIIAYLLVTEKILKLDTSCLQAIRDFLFLLDQ
jgi:hypothetical protein